MTRVFISYRRADSQPWADRIYPVLVKAFGKENVFKDIDSISAGQNFRAAIEKAIIQSDVVLILIGRQWVTITDNQGRKRLDNPDDAVRLEVEMALRHANVVIPVAVDAAQVPSSSDLPPSFNNLPFLNGASIRNDPDFDHDMTRLIRAIRERVGGSSRLSKPTSVSRFRIPVMIGILILILLMLGLALLNRQLPSSSVPTLPQQIAQIPTDSPTITNSAVPTLSSTEVEGTIQGEMDVAQTDIANTQLAANALETANAVATDARSSADKTAIATQWTATPTIDTRGTAFAGITETNAVQTNIANTQSAVNALGTANAVASETRISANKTGTATQWTLTPTIDTRGTALAHIAETQSVATQLALDLTSVAALWTHTPTSSPTEKHTSLLNTYDINLFTFPWTAQYYPNPRLFGKPSLIQSEANPSHDWGDSSPSASVPSDNFSARWTTVETLPSGRYQLNVRSDDGIRVAIDNIYYINEWHSSTNQVYSATVSLSAGQHPFMIEYYDAGGNAFIDFSFS